MQDSDRTLFSLQTKINSCHIKMDLLFHWIKSGDIDTKHKSTGGFKLLEYERGLPLEPTLREVG